jgi:uncharacterized protein YdaU (DUF1376 family)
VNYYERHLGDYARDAGHLTMLEHGAYTLLLDRYYTTEQGIPEDQAHRICRARTREERAAVDAVLAEFFRVVDGAWHNGRCDREVTKMQAKVKAAQENGKRGGRPKATKEEPGGLSVGLSLVTQKKAHQSPDTNTTTPPPPKGGADPEGFAEFWNSWPASDRKVARKQCATKWLRKGFNSQLPAIVAHVEAMKQSKQWRDGFEPAPLTYLNQERWGDGLPSEAESTSEAGFI